MAFSLSPDRRLSSEVRRIMLHQLEAATTQLASIGDPESDEAIHDARRRVKKVRAVIRLIRPDFDKAFRTVDKDLHDVNRLLAPIADGQGIIGTIDALGQRYRKLLPARVVAAIRAGLVELGTRTDRQAVRDHVLQTSAATLRDERRRVKHWQLRTDGFHTLAPGLEANFRKAREAMLEAQSRPTVHRYLKWRGLVKNHWFHVRLLESHCGHRLVADERRLEALDGLLGEYHNLALLREVLDHHGYVSRAQTARCLRAISAYQRLLRQHAQPLGATIYRETPRGFVRRVKHLWKESPSNHRTRQSTP